MSNYYLKQCWNSVKWELGVKLQWNLNQSMKTQMKTGRYMQNVTPFSTFRRFMPENNPFFSWFREFAPTFKKLPHSSRKWVRAWYTFWVGSGGSGNTKCLCVYLIWFLFFLFLLLLLMSLRQYGAFNSAPRPDKPLTWSSPQETWVSTQERQQQWRRCFMVLCITSPNFRPVLMSAPGSILQLIVLP